MPSALQRFFDCHGIRVRWPSPSEAMAEVRSRLEQTDAVLLFGAGGAGRRVRRWLAARGIEVVAILDNRHGGEFEGLPVFRPEAPPRTDLPILIASAWFVEIARQIAGLSWYSPYTELIPVPDPAQLEGRLFDDAFGAPFLAVLEEHEDAFLRVQRLWEDEASRRRFARLIAYRLGFFRPQLLNPSELPCPGTEYRVPRSAPVPAGVPAALESAVRQQLLNPYYTDGSFLQPRPGSMVIDGGAWIGDTAVWYADAVGAEGHVWAFEPDPHSLRALVANLAASPLSARITPRPQALAERTGHLRFHSIPGQSPSSYVGEGATQVSGVSIDELTADGTIPRVDLIKFDLEGADFAALRGAQETIRRFRPDLAVSVYHRPADLIEIPLWIQQQGLDYRLRFQHRHVSITESVCLASAR